MENVVYNELLVRGYDVDAGMVEVCSKDKDGKRTHRQLEVDFVVNQGSQRYYVQVAYDMALEEKQVQELRPLRSIPDSFKKIVIVSGTKKPWRKEKMGHLGAGALANITVVDPEDKLAAYTIVNGEIVSFENRIVRRGLGAGGWLCKFGMVRKTGVGDLSMYSYVR